MKLFITLLFLLVLMPATLVKANDPRRYNTDAHDETITFIIDGIKRYTDKQNELRSTEAWKEFLKNHPGWQVIFDELSNKPTRGIGSPYLIKKTSNGNGSDNKKKEEAIRLFIRQYFSAFGVNADMLETQRSNSHSDKYIHYDFKQYYRGLEVLNSRVHIRTDKLDRLVYFGIEYFDDIDLDINPAFGVDALKGKLAPYFKTEIAEIIVTPELKIVAVPGMNRYGYRLVYKLQVKTRAENPEEADYEVFLDAHTGKVIYKQKNIHHFAPPAGDLEIKGSAILTTPYDGPATVAMAYTRVKIGNDTYYTDSEGKLSVNITQPTEAIIYLDGHWSKTLSGNTSIQTPYLKTTIYPGQNELSLDSASGATLRHTTAYYHVNKIHDYIVNRIPGFTGMDFRMDTRVDRTDGSCNAFYNGNSINFYRTGGGCNSLALVPDVVYHEYGHAINYEFYEFMGSNFVNRALGEAYADIWALAITQNPVLGKGMGVSDTNRFVRRYDSNPKRYPENLVGQVHADGEIICGAWWDLGEKLGSMDSMMDIFVEALYALPNAFAGDEGSLYRDILIDALLADDDDADIFNGTPNFDHIITAFAGHGITLITGAQVSFNAIETARAGEPIDLMATVNTPFPQYAGDLVLYYKADTAQQWQNIALKDTTGNGMYQFAIPAFPKGAIIDYYLQLNDMIGNVATTIPFAASKPDEPNLPHKILVGYSLLKEEDFDDNTGNWVIGAADDDASTGIWETGTPIATYADANNPSERNMIQPGFDHTGKATNRCAFTGNSPASFGAGANDVDDGKTTLYSPVFDLTDYINPVVSYWRWFSNDKGANPGQEYWRVFISGDGTTWEMVEETRTSDNRWRQMALRVDDYVQQRDKVQVMFVASDYGGSLVEAAVDDLYIYDEADNSGISRSAVLPLKAYPNPASNVVTVSGFGKLQNAGYRLTDITGRAVKVEANTTGENLVLNTQKLSAGVYHLQVTNGNQNYSARIVVVR